MPDTFNSSVGMELAALRALGSLRRCVSARDRLLRERSQPAPMHRKPVAEPVRLEHWGADD